MANAALQVRIDRPCKLQFTIDSVTNITSLPEPFNICACTRGACASSAFSRPKVKGKTDPKNPAVEPVTLLCDVWWRPAVVRFACCDPSAGALFPDGDAVLCAGQWELLQEVECSARSNGPDHDFSIDLFSPNSTGDAVVSLSGKLCAVWDEQLCEDASCVGDTIDDMIADALAAHDDKRLDALAADLCASVSLMHCLSTIDLLSTNHELSRVLAPPDADCAAPAGDVHMRGVLPVIRRPPSASLRVHVADATAANMKAPSQGKVSSAKNTPRAAEAGDTDASRSSHPAIMPLQSAAHVNHTRPSTAHPSRKQHDVLDDVSSMHSGHARASCACKPHIHNVFCCRRQR
jgi:hypothetical protein